MKQESIQLNGTLISSSNIQEQRNELAMSNSWQNDIFTFLENWFDDSEHILTHTSGSTGQPKEIHLSKNVMRNSAFMTNSFFNLVSTKTALLCLPASYIAGKMMLVRAIIGGYNLISVEPSANPFETITQAIDFTAITPYQLIYSANTLKQVQIQHCIVGGGHVSAKMEELVATCSTLFYETYGMTETASHIALRCFNGKNKSNYFKALNGVSIRQDERNCLAILAPHLLEKEIITNDIVELRNDNEFRWLGRADSVINSGGIKIHPEQVEKKLESFLNDAFFISSLPDEILEHKIVLIIESDKFSAEKERELLINLKNAVSKYEMPKCILYSTHFERSTSNKILKLQTLAKILA